MASGNAIVRPDFEVTILDGKGEAVLVAGLFIEASGKVDVGVGWNGETELLGIRAILESVSLALTGVVAWSDRDDLVGANRKAKSEGDSIPF